MSTSGFDRDFTQRALARDTLMLRRMMNFLVDVVLTIEPSGEVSSCLTSNPTLPDWQESGENKHIWELFFAPDSNEAISFEMGLEQLIEDFLPEEMTLGQFPEKIEWGGRSYKARYQLERIDGEPRRVLLFLHDVSGRQSEEEAARENEEFRRVIETLMTNIEASRGFFGETDWLLDQIGPEADNDALKRHLHTLKGNFGCFGFDSLAHRAHEAEDALAVQDRDAALVGTDALRRGWDAQRAVYGPMFASRGDKEVVISRDEYEELVMSLMCQLDYAEILGMAQRWAMDPISSVFARLKMQVTRVSSILSRKVDVVIEDNMVRLPGKGLQPLWSSLVHVAVNAVTHGIEPPDERVERGKPEAGVFTMEAELDDDFLYVRLSDDGRGIDWERIRDKAVSAGMPGQSQEDLTRALFAAGISTASETSMVAGRGMGTNALWQAVHDLGGDIRVSSELGEGTRFEVLVPLARLATMGLLS